MAQQNPSLYVAHKKDNCETSIWLHFWTNVDKKTAKCKKCGAILKTLGGSTKGLHTHSFTKHNMRVRREEVSGSSYQINAVAVPPMKRKFATYFESSVDTSLDATLARMAALDGLPFNVFVTSQDLRRLLIANGFKDLPSSVAAVRHRIINYAMKMKEQVVREVIEHKDSGKKCSITINEWTSTLDKRYGNIVVRSGSKCWDLGLARVHGSMKSEECGEILEKRLNEFGLSIDNDIVALVTDGFNSNIGVGKLFNIQHQLCLAHGLHLAVCDVLYKEIITEHSESFSETFIPITTDPLAANTDDDDENIKEGFDMGLTFLPASGDNRFEFSDEQNKNDLVRKVRKIALILQTNPIKNYELHKYLKADEGKELSLVVDCKASWSSLLSMLERFLAMKTSIQKALMDINYPEPLEEHEFKLLAEIVDVLTPIKIAVEILCRHNANLCMADAVLNFLMCQISLKGSTFADRMLHSLTNRIAQRRKEDLSGVLKYLQNPVYDDDNNFELFKVANRTLIRKQINNIVTRLDKCKLEPEVDEFEEVEEEKPQVHWTLKEMFENEIKKSMKPAQIETQLAGRAGIIQTEMNLYEGGGTRGCHLEQAYQYLVTIPPTSAEPERVFSSPGCTGKKIRSHLSDEALDALVFLRSYFRQIGQMDSP